mgnify:CR=1 FL=1
MDSILIKTLAAVILGFVISAVANIGSPGPGASPPGAFSRC